MSARTTGGGRWLHIAGSLAEADEDHGPVVGLAQRLGPRIVHSLALPAMAAEPAAKRAAGSPAGTLPGERLAWPLLAAGAGPRRLQALAEAMRPYDLVLTYGWGAINAVLAHTAFGPRLELGPLVHHERALPPDEGERRKLGRNLRRMLAFARVSALIVPTERIGRIAVAEWKVAPGKVRRIAPGIVEATDRPRKPRRDALPRVVKRSGESFLGVLAGEGEGTDHPMLVRAFASLPDPWHLVLIGETPQGEAILAEAARLAVGHRVHLAGSVPDLPAALGLCDLFCHLGGSGALPLDLIGAMAAGLAVAGFDSGGAAGVIGEGNRRFLVPQGDQAALAAALADLAAHPALRGALGNDNRRKALADFGRSAAIDRHLAVYAQALGRPSLP